MLICASGTNSVGCGALNVDSATFCQQCGRSLTSALHIQNPGTRIGTYIIVRILGYGGFGAVYEAEDTRNHGNRVALKETFDPTSIRSFRSEFAALGKLQHPNLPHYYDTFEAQAKGYLVMELVPGQSLEDVLQHQQGPLLEAQVLGYAAQLCDALTYLHQQSSPIIHRDIKPANIRLTPSGLIKLVDFGLHKQGNQQTHTFLRGIGTLAYAPVEQYGTGGAHTEPRSDIYSLGATLYHLLTGQEPPAAPIRLAAAADTLPSPRQCNPQLSPHVAQAVIKAMSLRPHDRYADAAAFRRALLSGSASNTQRHQLRSGMIALCMLLVLACAVVLSIIPNLTNAQLAAWMDSSKSNLQTQATTVSTVVELLDRRSNATQAATAVAVAAHTMPVDVASTPTSRNNLPYQTISRDATLLQNALVEAFSFHTIHRFGYIMKPITRVEVIPDGAGKKKIFVQWAIDDNPSFYVNFQGDIQTILKTVVQSDIDYDEVQVRGTYFLIGEHQSVKDDNSHWTEVAVVDATYAKSVTETVIVSDITIWPPPVLVAAKSLWLEPNFEAYIKGTVKTNK